MSYNPIIFGKSDKERIVAIEIVDPNVELYIQDVEGKIHVEYLPNKYWILSDCKLQKDWVRLKGELHYKYGKQFVEREEFTKWRGILGKKNDIFTIWNPQEAAMVKDGVTLFKGMKTSDISVLSFDLETTGTTHDETSIILIIANTFRDAKGAVTRKMFCYNEYNTPGEMLTAWCKWVRDINPTVICGHNINSFDLPYLDYIASMNNVSLSLGRDGSNLQIANNDSKFRKEGSQFINYKKCKIFGRHIIDTFFLAIKYDVGRKYESYALKSIIAQEGMEVEGRQHYDASQIRKNYKVPLEWQKIKRYAEFDGDDSLKLYDLMCPAYFYMTQSIPKTYQLITESATGSQINSMMIRSYLQDKHSLPKADEVTHFEGAISYAKPGIWKNCIRWDVSSLYPSIMLQYKVQNLLKDPMGNFQKILSYFTTERLKNKQLGKTDKFYKDLEQMQKILCNSFYGFLSTAGLLFNYPNGAAEITRQGREILKKAILWASNEQYQETIQD